MSIGDFLNAPVSTLLVVAGLIFLLLSVATVKRPIVIDINEGGRKFAGVIGALLLITGIVLAPPKDVPGSPTTTPTPTIPPPATETHPSNTPRFEVQAIDQPFFRPEDRPLRYIKIPPRVKTFGITYFVTKESQLSLWIITCAVQSSVPCTITRLKLDARGEWDEFIEIGNRDDDCKIFNVTFLLVGDDVSRTLIDRLPDGISNSEFKSLEFTDKDTYEVKRALNDNYLDVQPPCP